MNRYSTRRKRSVMLSGEEASLGPAPDHPSELAHLPCPGEEAPSQQLHPVKERLEGLAPIAHELMAIVAQPEFDCPELWRLGFGAVRSAEKIIKSMTLTSDCPPCTKGILVISKGKDCQVALECCKALDKIPSVPPILVTLIMPLGEPCDGALEDIQSVWKALFEAGADDVVSLFGQETLTCHRVREAIHRTEILARKAAAMINMEVEAVKKKAARTLQAKRFMWDLPGTALQSIPFMDNSIEERTEGDVGVGDYAFVNRLGAGTFGAVYRAEHPVQGTVAVKVLPKASVKTMSQLFSIDSELCIMLNLARHPCVVRAHAAMHTASNIILVMEHAGDMNLHNFSVMTLKNSGEEVLPLSIVEPFLKQEAAALAHLHACMVCHRDLKPTNFIVSNDGKRVRLTDFGLATLLCGPDQSLSHCCGSLPFVAPEVLELMVGAKDKQSRGTYNGFAADVWSLAANFVELSCGLYSLERILGWLPQHPTSPEQQRQDLAGLGAVWARTPPPQAAGLHSVVAGMLVLQPEARRTIRQVVSEGGLCIEGLKPCPPHGSLCRLEPREPTVAEGVRHREVVAPATPPQASQTRPRPCFSHRRNVPNPEPDPAAQPEAGRVVPSA